MQLQYDGPREVAVTDVAAAEVAETVIGRILYRANVYDVSSDSPRYDILCKPNRNCPSALFKLMK